MTPGGAVRVNRARSAFVGMPAWRPPGAVRTASRGATAAGVEQARIGAPGATMGQPGRVYRTGILPTVYQDRNVRT